MRIKIFNLFVASLLLSSCTRHNQMEDIIIVNVENDYPKKEYILQWKNSTWMNLEDFILKEINQSKKDKHYIISLI